MTARHISNSLIPYLNPEPCGIHLKISFSHKDQSALEKAQSPFLIINDSGPVARIVEARFMTNAGSTVKNVFLIVQKDSYLLSEKTSLPINNLDIDLRWQQAFSRYVGNVRDDRVSILPEQIGQEGGLTPFMPLFLCKDVDAFFHPPCPHCGAYLEQCYDDEMLAGIGLAPYSASLKRYLFCPSCHASIGRSDFYTASKDDADPQFLKDRGDLIRSLKSICEDKNATGIFPCPGCSVRQECYGDENLLLSRIEPFSFYPFYMIIFNEMSPNAFDFLAFISGSSQEHRRFSAELLNDLDDIREKIKNNMFRQAEVITQTVAEGAESADRAIYYIIKGIAQRREKDFSISAPESPQPAMPQQELGFFPKGYQAILDDGDFFETVILTPDDLVKTGHMPLDQEATMDKTVILSPSGISERASEKVRPKDTDMAETAIISPAAVNTKAAEEDNLGETVIISPSPDGAHPRPVAPQKIQEDHMPETVILSKDAMSFKQARKQSDDESLAETVIIRPVKK
ncbi:conserved hypothetical protein [uncultured Desulfobacterium sp.]|uniref:Uncharacterized protein n=1 Tax=uncultured Desulfobacterium sp. TaxID=201089 RepID=A0A445N1Y9_9BACT|nr:conserved hypothetical protein [uncultured Desulfobacterium sp.]